MDQYERDVSRLCLRFPRKHITEITDVELGAVLRAFPPASRRVRAAAYRSFFKWCIRTRRIDRNPFDLMPAIKRTPQKHVETFTDVEVEALYALGGLDGTLMRLLIGTGLRKGEARRLKVSHTQIERNRVLVIAGKGGKDRIVPMTPELRKDLAERMLVEGLNGSDFWWYSVKANDVYRKVLHETPIGEGTFHRWWAAKLKLAGVPYRKPHTSRHTFATAWRKRGLAVDDLQMLLGHESVATTSDLYVWSTIDDVADRMAALLEARG